MPSITMPQLGESVTEGTIGRWLKKPGDRVRRDDPLVEIITDKVNAEIPAPTDGVLERITAAEGAVVTVGQEIAFLTSQSDRTPREIALPSSSSTVTGAEGNKVAAPETAGGQPADDDAPRLSPLVRKLIRDHNLDIRLIHGTGLAGRVTRDDVETYVREQSATATSRDTAPTLPSESAETRLVPNPMRRTIAQRMSRSVHEIPHAWLMIEADVTRLVRFRDEIKEHFRLTTGVGLSYVPFLMRAAAESLREYPIVNASWSDDQIALKRDVNLGVAVALDDGLVVPVIRNADTKGIADLARSLADVVERARTGKLTVADVEGGTFTVNNTGALGSIASQPIINYPQAAIMTMEAIVKRPVVVDDAIAIRSIVNLCLSFDHRVLDGALAAAFLQSVRRRLESWGPGSAL